jgi:hypothetical protein
VFQLARRQRQPRGCGNGGGRGGGCTGGERGEGQQRRGDYGVNHAGAEDKADPAPRSITNVLK